MSPPPNCISADGVEDWPRMEKADVARRLLERIASELLGDDGSVWT